MLIIPHKLILQFLTTQEIAELHYINKLHLLFLRQLKAIKNSIWRGDLPNSILQGPTRRLQNAAPA
jgi:hypothetical protein